MVPDLSGLPGAARGHGGQGARADRRRPGLELRARRPDHRGRGLPGDPARAGREAGGRLPLRSPRDRAVVRAAGLPASRRRDACEKSPRGAPGRRAVRTGLPGRLHAGLLWPSLAVSPDLCRLRARRVRLLAGQRGRAGRPTPRLSVGGSRRYGRGGMPSSPGVLCRRVSAGRRHRRCPSPLSGGGGDDLGRCEAVVVPQRHRPRDAGRAHRRGGPCARGGDGMGRCPGAARGLHLRGHPFGARPGPLCRRARRWTHDQPASRRVVVSARAEAGQSRRRDGTGRLGGAVGGVGSPARAARRAPGVARRVAGTPGQPGSRLDRRVFPGSRPPADVGPLRRGGGARRRDHRAGPVPVGGYGPGAHVGVDRRAGRGRLQPLPAPPDRRRTVRAGRPPLFPGDRRRSRRPPPLVGQPGGRRDDRRRRAGTGRGRRGTREGPGRARAATLDGRVGGGGGPGVWLASLPVGEGRCGAGRGGRRAGDRRGRPSGHRR